MTPLTQSRNFSTLLLPLLAGMAAVALLTILLMQPALSHAAPPPKPKPKSHVVVDLVLTGTTVSFSSPALTLARNGAGKASITLINKTKLPQTVTDTGTGVKYPLRPNQALPIAVPVGQTNLSDGTATLTITVK